MLLRIRDLFATLRDSATAASSDPAELLVEFEAELRAHFRCEEDEEYFGTIGGDDPKLEAQVAHLLNEHAELLEAIRSLHAVALARSRHAELGALFASFTERLRAHEQAESRLVNEFFGLR